MGKYPIEAVGMMTQIIQEAEGVTHWGCTPYTDTGLRERDIEKKALISAAISTANILGTRAVIIFTKS